MRRDRGLRNRTACLDANHQTTRLWAAVLICIAAVLPARAARAGSGGYFTAYDHRIERGEFELMLMNDATVPSRANRAEGQHNYLSQMVELEYGVTEQFATELMLESFVDAEGLARFTGVRWENRYRLFKRETALNPVLYMEYEHLDLATRYKMEVSGWVHPPYREAAESEQKDERIMETRLILSHDLGQTNLTVNWINETDLRTGRTDFGHALGVMHHRGGESHHHGGAHHHADTAGDGERHTPRSPWLAGYGVELLGALGDDRRLAFSPSDQQHYLQPLALFHLGGSVMVHTGVAIGLSKASDRVLVRTAFGFDL